jgi:hypothetical protein
LGKYFLFKGYGKITFIVIRWANQIKTKKSMKKVNLKSICGFMVLITLSYDFSPKNLNFKMNYQKR